MKYEIKKIDEDNFELIGNGVDIKFKKNIAMAKKLQSINAKARIKMINFMKEEGIKKEDLIDRIEKDGKIIYDESSYRELEKGFIEDETISVTNELVKETLKMNMQELISKLEITDENEAIKLGEELGKCLFETPSK